MNKKPNPARGIPAPANQRPLQVKPPIAPRVVQPKIVSPPLIKKPVAPPVYRPQPAPKVVQPKLASMSAIRKAPNARPVYRPPAAPVYQPKQQNLVQRKVNLPNPVAVAQRLVAQAKPATPVGLSSVIQQVRGPKKGGKKAAKKAQRKAVVVLTIGSGTFRGQSSGQYGHAEMQALRNFITQQPSVADAWRTLNRAARKKVRCPNQPVCGSCTMVLEALGFEPDHMTQFSNAKSGGVSWGANMKVRELMEYGGLEDTYASAVRAGAK